MPIITENLIRQKNSNNMHYKTSKNPRKEILKKSMMQARIEQLGYGNCGCLFPSKLTFFKQFNPNMLIMQFHTSNNIKPQ
jgi:hypothetical protein